MVQRALVKLPNSRDARRPTGSSRNQPRPHGPGREKQGQRFEPTFNRLADALERDDAAVELRDDPLGIAPDRALVFVTAGAINDFVQAAERAGLSVISEIEYELDDISDDFSPPKENAPFSPVLYATMPTLESIRQLLTLWEAYKSGETLPRGFTPWKNLFELLVEIRVWGPEDRLPVSSREAILENLPFDDADPVRLELEILPLTNRNKRREWNQKVCDRVAQLEGRVIDTCSINEDGFIYEALLIELSTASVKEMLDNPHDTNGLATVEGIKLILPQTVAQAPIADIDNGNSEKVFENNFNPEPPFRCALFDGTAVAAHPALDGGIGIEDINDLVRFSQVANRYHATSMASLILRGDLDSDGIPLEDSRVLNVPVLVDSQNNQATSPSDRLFVDIIHSTLSRLFSTHEPLEHSVFVINFSIGIPSERYAGQISSLARLLDWWSYAHGVLFVISAGNIFDDLILRNLSNREFEAASDEEKQSIIRNALRDFSYDRTLLAPAESINGLTVGALSEDLSNQSLTTPNTFKLEGNHGSTVAISSALGPGKAKTVKPDIVTSGGLHEYSLYPARDDSRLSLRANSPINGLVVASPRLGAVSVTHRSRGTSCATALATRAILQSASALTEEGGPFQGEELPRQDIALLSRALTVNSAIWSDDAIELYEEEKGIHGPRKHFKSKEQVSKYWGYGALSPDFMRECTEHRATMIGLGTISKDQARVFDLPLPPSLSGDRIGRTLRVTLAWFSPVDSIGARYKMASLEAFCGDEIDTQDNEWGLGLKSLNLDEKIVSRGSVWSRRLRHKRLDAPVFDEEATIPIRVQCRDSANGNLNPDLDIRFALVVSLEVENTAQYDIHEEIFNKVRIRMQQT